MQRWNKCDKIKIIYKCNENGTIKTVLSDRLAEETTVAEFQKSTKICSEKSNNKHNKVFSITN